MGSRFDYKEVFREHRLLILSLSLLLFFAVMIFGFTRESYNAIESTSLWIRDKFGYFYLYLGLGSVLVLTGIAISPLGKIKLGQPDEKPEHSWWAWISMLYSAGMGAGILLRAVQEPVFMLQNPPYVSAASKEILALEYTFYQWGFTPWAFYGLFAMVIGYVLFVQQGKVRASSVIADRIPNRWAHSALDIITILTTIFGLIAAIGLGTTQITGGLGHLSGKQLGIGITLLLATVVSVIAFISVWQGVNRGIKLISKLNIVITLLLLLVVFMAGDMSRIVFSFFQALLAYLIDFIPMSVAFGAYDPGIAFLTDWTFYYWAFWLAWAPFTGIFIARISKGRKLRELLLGVMIIPSLGTFIWFTTFGTSAFDLINSWEAYHGELDNVFTSLFVFFESYPFATLFNILSVVLLISFLVTSVDSAILVLSMFTDRGRKTPRKEHRLLWSVFVLLATLAILILGQARPDIDVLVAIQKLLIITSLPFAIFMIGMVPLFFLKIAKKGPD